LVETSSDSASVGTLNSESFQEFIKKNHGQYTVLFDFEAAQEDDITVRQGERVTVLNKDDRDWYWVKTHKGEEGFAPRQYLQYFSSRTQSGRFFSVTVFRTLQYKLNNFYGTCFRTKSFQ
jgi:hypothetical protein